MMTSTFPARRPAACALAASWLFTFAFAAAAHPPHHTTAGTLKVTVEYKATGKVDATHRIWIWVFDTPNIDGSSTPLATDALSENGASVTFSGLPDTVYIAVAYDEKGGYDGTAGPPPSGTPVSILGGAAGATAVKTGDEAKVTVTFDDTTRMP